MPRNDHYNKIATLMRATAQRGDKWMVRALFLASLLYDHTGINPAPILSMDKDEVYKRLEERDLSQWANRVDEPFMETERLDPAELVSMMETIAADCLCVDPPYDNHEDPDKRDYNNPSCHDQYCPHYLFAWVLAKAEGQPEPE